MLGFFAAVSMGVCIVLSRTVGARLSERTSPQFSTLMNYITGLSVAFLVALFAGAKVPDAFPPLRIATIPLFLGGAIGALLIFINNLLTGKMPSYTLTLLLFYSQLIMGILIDLFFYQIFSPQKLAGSILIAVGMALNRPKKKTQEKP